MMNWYNEFRDFCPSVPCMLVGNKIDRKLEFINRPSFKIDSRQKVNRKKI